MPDLFERPAPALRRLTAPRRGTRATFEIFEYVGDRTEIFAPGPEISLGAPAQVPVKDLILLFKFALMMLQQASRPRLQQYQDLLLPN